MQNTNSTSFPKDQASVLQALYDWRVKGHTVPGAGEHGPWTHHLDCVPTYLLGAEFNNTGIDVESTLGVLAEKQLIEHRLRRNLPSGTWQLANGRIVAANVGTDIVPPVVPFGESMPPDGTIRGVPFASPTHRCFLEVRLNGVVIETGGALGTRFAECYKLTKAGIELVESWQLADVDDGAIPLTKLQRRIW
ncbi:unnamed protein product, partial [marine sediment metagenome]